MYTKTFSYLIERCEVWIFWGETLLFDMLSVWNTGVKFLPLWPESCLVVFCIRIVSTLIALLLMTKGSFLLTLSIHHATPLPSFICFFQFTWKRYPSFLLLCLLDFFCTMFCGKWNKDVVCLTFQYDFSWVNFVIFVKCNSWNTIMFFLSTTRSLKSSNVRPCVIKKWRQFRF